MLIVQHPGKAATECTNLLGYIVVNWRTFIFLISDLMDSFIICFGLVVLALLFSFGKILLSQLYNQFCFVIKVIFSQETYFLQNTPDD